MNILDKIITAKRKEVQLSKKQRDIKAIQKLILDTEQGPSLYNALLKPGPAFICEFKRRSPSKGELNKNAKVENIVPGYEKAGASAVSILTDPHFDGHTEDLKAASAMVTIPLLRKDFIIDEYQIIEAKLLGATAILLIAAVLSKDDILIFSRLARDLGLDVLLELHKEDELDKICELNKIIGINNRDLSTFRVDLEQSVKLAGKLPDGVIKVSESGISEAKIVKQLYMEGFQAFLIGENFMIKDDPAKAAADFIMEVNSEAK